MPSFEELNLVHVPREQNARADLLSKLASTKKPGNNKSVIQETLNRPSIENKEVFFLREECDSWMGPIISYLEHGTVLSDRDATKKLIKEAARYTIIAGRLYRRGFTTPLLLCLAEGQVDYVLQEIHEGICGTHIGGRAIASKVLRAGYYWPTLRADSARFVQKCDKCQKHANMI